MMTRSLHEDDIPILRAICENQKFPFPNLEEISLATVVDNGIPIAVGFVRRIYESIIAIDQSQNKATRTHAFQAIIKEGIFQSQNSGISQWHSFVEDEKVEYLLKKRFGFTDVKGKALIVDL